MIQILTVRYFCLRLFPPPSLPYGTVPAKQLNEENKSFRPYVPYHLHTLFFIVCHYELKSSYNSAEVHPYFFDRAFVCFPYCQSMCCSLQYSSTLENGEIQHSTIQYNRNMHRAYAREQYIRYADAHWSLMYFYIRYESGSTS